MNPLAELGLLAGELRAMARGARIIGLRDQASILAQIANAIEKIVEQLEGRRK